MPNWKKLIVSGSDASLNSLVVATNVNAQSFTGSLFGTSSWSQNAQTASYVANAISASYAQTASYAVRFNVSQSLTASGLRYPTADNGNESFIQTDGAGNLSLQYVKSMYETVRNRETSSITSGTPLFVSGATGANSDVYIANASNPARMPATYIASETIAPSATGKALISGLLTNFNTTAYQAGQEIFVATGSGLTTSRPPYPASVQLLGIITRVGVNGQAVILNPGQIEIQNIQPGYVLVGNSIGTPTAVATASLSVATASFVTASNVYGPYGASSVVSASYALTASYADNITVSGAISNVDYIDFDTNVAYTLAEGRLGWDNGEGTLQLGLEGGNVQYALGEQIYQYVYNAEPTTLTKGQVVYVSGSQGNTIAVKLASDAGDPTSAGTLGLVAETITSGGNGWVITEGPLRKLNTLGLTAGGLVFLSSTPGAYTQTPPTAPSHSVRLGYVERVSATVGSIYVKVDNGYELGELHDIVDTTTTSSYGDLLVKSGSVWTNSKQLTGSYGLTGSLTFVNGGLTGSLQGTASWAIQAQTASYADTFKVANNAVISGSLTILQNLTVFGSASITYITQSTLDIATNLITVNTDTPGVRFGGLAVADSGSTPRVSGSWLFDSIQDRWIFIHQSNIGSAITSSIGIMGPETYNNLGNETQITLNRLTKGYSGASGEHIGDSQVSDDGTTVSIPGNLTVTGSITGLINSASFAATASYVLQAVSASFATSASYALSSSYALNATSASFATSASYAFSSSYALSSSYSLSGSYALTSSGVQGGAATYIPLWTSATTLSSSAMYQTQSLTVAPSGLAVGTSATSSILSFGGADNYGTINVMRTVTTSSIRSTAVQTNIDITGSLTGRATGIFNSISIPVTNVSTLNSVRGSQNWLLFRGSGSIAEVMGHFNFIQNYTSSIITLRGDLNQIEHYGTRNITTILTNHSLINHYGLGTITRVYGIDASINNRVGGTITSAIPFGAQVQNLSTGTIGTAYGISIGGPNDNWTNSGGGTVTTSYGVYIGSSIDIGATQYAIYSEATSSTYIKGNVGINKTVPVYNLDVDGAGNFSTNLTATGSIKFPSLSNVAQLNVVGYDSTTGQLYYQTGSSLSVTSASYAATASSADSFTVRNSLFVPSISDQTVLYKSGTVVTGSSDFVWNYTANQLTINGGASSGQIQVNPLGVDGVYLGAGATITSGEAGLYSANSDQAIALYDPSVNNYYYSNGNYKFNNNVNVHQFTGSVAITQNVTASNALITGTITAQTLVVQTVTSSIVYSSGSNRFGNQLSDTQQFTGSVSITGSLVASLTNVNQVNVVSYDTTTGQLYYQSTSSLSVTSASYAATASYATVFNISSSLYSAGARTAPAGAETAIITLNTGSYTAAFFDYTVSSGSNARAGTVMSVWNGASVQYTDNSTLDIGTTSDITLKVETGGANLQLVAATSAFPWTVKTTYRLI